KNMFHKYLITLGERLRFVSRNKEALQYITLALIPVVVIGGYYVLQNLGSMQQPSQVLSVSEERANDIKQDNQLSTAEDPPTEEVVIKVDISGAVISPGLKELPNGSRVNDALEVAG